MLLGYPPFRGNKEPEQIEKIFEKCGTPTEEIWPGVTNLPNYNTLCPKTKYPNVLKNYYSDNKKIDDCTYELINRMLELDPTKRITAKEALDHEFFSDRHYPPRCLPEE